MAAQARSNFNVHKCRMLGPWYDGGLKLQLDFEHCTITRSVGASQGSYVGQQDPVSLRAKQALVRVLEVGGRSGDSANAVVERQRTGDWLRLQKIFAKRSSNRH